MSKPLAEKISFHIQRNSHNVQLRNFLCGIHRFFLPKMTKNEGINSLSITKDENGILNELKTEGFSDLGLTLSADQIATIIEKLENLPAFDTAKQNSPLVNLINPADDVQLAHYKRGDLAEIPDIVAIANDSRILNVVSRYFGVKPTISNINCWWSFGNRESAKEAQFFHRDMDDYKFLKLFFYLTDVNEDNGPHIYVKGSHKSNKLTELRRFNDEEITDNFNSSSIAVLMRQKGSCFLEDTYGIHKGQLPLVGNRLLLQIQYSYLPLYVEKYSPSKYIMQDLKLDKYINRLLFDES